jgi:hypothetical protein
MGRARAIITAGFTLVELMIVVGATSGLVMVSMLILKKKATYTKKLATQMTPAAVTANGIKNSLSSTYKVEEVGSILKLHANRHLGGTLTTQILSFENKSVRKIDAGWSDLPLEYRKGRDSYQWVVRKDHSSGKEILYWDLKEIDICWPHSMDCTHLNFNQPSTGSASRLLLQVTPHHGKAIESVMFLDNYLDGEQPRENIQLIR